MDGDTAAKSCRPQREKYWSELQESEKIERMRQQVKQLQGTLDRAMTLITKLTRHKHIDDRVVLIEDLNGGEVCGYGYYGG